MFAGGLALAALGAAAVFDAASAKAGGSSVSTISDPVGDDLVNSPEFQDLVGGRLTKRANGDLEVLLEVAGPVPAAPPLPPPGVREIWWWWFFDLDPSAEPQGYPFPPLAQGPDFLVVVSWNGTAFAGTAIDRRPLFTGGEAILTPVSFTIDGTKVGAVLPRALIRDFPASFDWDPRTLSWSSPVGGGGFNRVDGASFATFEF
jgi:hypothetical protein